MKARQAVLVAAPVLCGVVVVCLVGWLAFGGAGAKKDLDSRGQQREASSTEQLQAPAALAEQPVPRVAEPDPELVASMECKPLDLDRLFSSEYGPGFEDRILRGVQVEVGEGNEPGSRWWLVLVEQPGDAGDPRVRRCALLTNAPGLETPVERRMESFGGEAVYISLPEGDRWRDVDWDDAKLVRAASALECASRYLGEDDGSWVWGEVA